MKQSLIYLEIFTCITCIFTVQKSKLRCKEKTVWGHQETIPNGTTHENEYSEEKKDQIKKSIKLLSFSHIYVGEIFLYKLLNLKYGVNCQTYSIPTDI